MLLRFSRLLHDVMYNCRESGEIRRNERTASIASADAESWLKRYSQENGDNAPDVDRIYLPSCNTKKDVYEDFKEYCEEYDKTCICLTSFMNMWKKKFPKVTIPKVSNQKLILRILNILNRSY